MEAPDGAVYCDFCKEPFAKKTPSPAAKAPAAPAADPLAGLPKEKVLELPVDQLLKKDAPAGPEVPTWLRPLAYGFLALMLVAGLVALFLLQQRYLERQPVAPPPGAAAPLPR